MPKVLRALYSTFLLLYMAMEWSANRSSKSDSGSAMEEKQRSMQKSVRQQGTVPFLWEEKPGTPKKDWKLEPVSVNVVQPPVKLVTMIPFKWEEKPGTPLPGFSYPQRDSQPLPDCRVLPLPPAKLVFPPSAMNSPCSSPARIREKLRNVFSAAKLYLNEDKEEGEAEAMNSPCSSPARIREKLRNMFSAAKLYLNEDKEEGEAEEYDDDEYSNGDSAETETDSLELDIEASDSDTRDSFRAAPALLANCFISEEAISSAVPVDQYITEEEEEDCDGQTETPRSVASETESYFSSSAAGSGSFRGSSFMECFFLRFPTDSGYLVKDHCDKEICSPAQPDPDEYNHTKRTPTLGELIRDVMKGFGGCISSDEDEANVQNSA